MSITRINTPKGPRFRARVGTKSKTFDKRLDAQRWETDLRVAEAPEREGRYSLGAPVTTGQLRKSLQHG